MVFEHHQETGLEVMKQVGCGFQEVWSSQEDWSFTLFSKIKASEFEMTVNRYILTVTDK